MTSGDSVFVRDSEPDVVVPLTVVLEIVVVLDTVPVRTSTPESFIQNASGMRRTQPRKARRRNWGRTSPRKMSRRMRNPQKATISIGMRGIGRGSLKILMLALGG